MKDIKYYFVLGVLILGNVVLTYKNVRSYRENHIADVGKMVSNEVIVKEDKKVQSGEASWYDYDYPKGSDNWVTKNKLVVASRDYPRGTKLRVCNKECVIVTVTDYGPEERTGRIIDMGSFAFSKICKLRLGVCTVEIYVE